MAIMMILDWEGVTPEQYARVNDTMGIHSDADAPDGLISHVAAIDDAGELTIVDLWESERALGQFVETIFAQPGSKPCNSRVRLQFEVLCIGHSKV